MHTLCSRLVRVPAFAPYSLLDTGRTLRDEDRPAVWKTAAVVIRDRPDFQSFTPLRAALGGIGRSVAALAGNRILHRWQVEDPANWICHQLARCIEDEYGTRFTGKRKAGDETPPGIALLCHDMDCALDVRTRHWALDFYPADPSVYRVAYSSEMRLIDCHTGEVIVEAVHSRVPGQTLHSPGHRDLVGDRAVGLKRELRVAAAECLSHFRAVVLELPQQAL